LDSRLDLDRGTSILNFDVI